MCLICLSSEQHNLYINSYIYKYTYGSPGSDWLMSQRRDYDVSPTWNVVIVCVGFKLPIYLSSLHLIYLCLLTGAIC